MLAIKSVSLRSAVPFAGTGLAAASEAMGLSLTLLPVIRCVRLEVTKRESRHFGEKILIPLEMVVKMEEVDLDAPLPVHGPEAPPPVQTCDLGGAGADVDPSTLFNF